MDFVDHNVVLTLLDDTIITAKNMSTDTSPSLNYIPGRMLLGACAARLYQTLSPHDRFQVFHSGHVRFMDARPTHKIGSGYDHVY